MKLLTKALRQKLISNFRNQDPEHSIDFKPVVRIIAPFSQATFLLTELDPETNIAFGLCDVGHPKLAYVSITELEELRGPFNVGLERDYNFTATKTISQYADDARKAGRIVL